MKEWFFDNFHGCFATGMAIIILLMFYLLPSGISQPDPMEVKYKAVLMENNELRDQVIRLQAVKNFIDNAGVTIVYNGCDKLVNELSLEKQGPPTN